MQSVKVLDVTSALNLLKCANQITLVLCGSEILLVGEDSALCSACSHDALLSGCPNPMVLCSLHPSHGALFSGCRALMVLCSLQHPSPNSHGALLSGCPFPMVLCSLTAPPPWCSALWLLYSKHCLWLGSILAEASGNINSHKYLLSLATNCGMGDEPFHVYGNLHSELDCMFT